MAPARHPATRPLASPAYRPPALPPVPRPAWPARLLPWPARMVPTARQAPRGSPALGRPAARPAASGSPVDPAPGTGSVACLPSESSAPPARPPAARHPSWGRRPAAGPGPAAARRRGRGVASSAERTEAGRPETRAAPPPGPGPGPGGAHRARWGPEAVRAWTARASLRTVTLRRCPHPGVSPWRARGPGRPGPERVHDRDPARPGRVVRRRSPSGLLPYGRGLRDTVVTGSG
jgi:hypothetical protein